MGEYLDLVHPDLRKYQGCCSTQCKSPLFSTWLSKPLKCECVMKGFFPHCLPQPLTLKRVQHLFFYIPQSPLLLLQKMEVSFPKLLKLCNKQFNGSILSPFMVWYISLKIFQFSVKVLCDNPKQVLGPSEGHSLRTKGMSRHYLTGHMLAEDQIH